MRPGVGVAALLATAALAAGQDPGGEPAKDAPREIALPCAWPVGTKWRIERTQEKTDIVEGAERRIGKARTPADLEVLERTDDGAVLAWTWGRTEIADAPANVPGWATKLQDLGANLRIELQLDETATPVGVRNLDALQRAFAEAMELTLAGMREAGRPAAEHEGARRMLSNLKSPEAVALFATKEPILYLMACGSALELGTPVAYADRLPNPFGGEPLASRAQFLLTGITSERKQAEIEWTQTLDPEGTKAFVQGYLKALAVGSGRPPPDQLPDMAITDRSTFVMDTESGRPLVVTHARQTRIGPQRRIERTEFRVLPDPPPADAGGK